MNTFTTSDGTNIFYKDGGSKTAPAIVFHHGWPLSADDWDNQMMTSWQKAFASLPTITSGTPLRRHGAGS